jgi:flagellar hook-length control protein FliK
MPSALQHVSLPAPASGQVAAQLANATPGLYDKLDQGAAPAVLHSGPQHVAVGVHDPDLGWVEIKMQNMSGRVDAMLTTSSAQAHASLAAQLPAMAEYLGDRDLKIGTLAVHHEMAGADAGDSPGNGSGNGNAGAPNSNRNDRENPGREGSPLRNPGAGIFPSGSPPGNESPAFRPMSYISIRA